MRKILIDTDPGVDDAMAIQMAFAHPGLEVVGLTTVFGNVLTPTATRNALRLVELARLSTPVAEGASKPLLQPLRPPASHVHGEEGFGAVPGAAPTGRPDPRDAARFIRDMVAASPGEVTLCPVGPLTNIAAALRLDRSIAQKVAGVVIMGGAVKDRAPRRRGNVTLWAEANIWNDPHAAAEVLAADWDVTLVGLDVTEQVRCGPEDFDGLAQASPDIGGFLRDASQFYCRWHRERDGFDGCFLHDPAAVVAILRPELFVAETISLRVVVDGDRVGCTEADPGGASPTVRVCVDVDAAAVKDFFLSTLRSADAMRDLRG